MCTAMPLHRLIDVHCQAFTQVLETLTGPHVCGLFPLIYHLSSLLSKDPYPKILSLWSFLVDPGSLGGENYL